jgi:hypothetical protein
VKVVQAAGADRPFRTDHGVQPDARPSDAPVGILLSICASFAEIRFAGVKATVPFLSGAGLQKMFDLPQISATVSTVGGPEPATRNQTLTLVGDDRAAKG